MANVVRERVEGIGIYEHIENITLGQYFTEIAIPEIVKIPDVKPDIEELLSVMVDAKVISLRIIDTPTGTSAEGQKLDGKKLSVELELQQKVKYIADEPTQSVHAAHFTKLVSSIFIVVPKEIKFTVTNPTPPPATIDVTVDVETLLRQGRIIVTPYIEDIYGEQLDNRTVFKNITVLLVAKFINC